MFVTGRLLRANQIIFNWDRLASWINLTEEWPYRTSWLILFLEENDIVSDQVTLKTIYERSDFVLVIILPLFKITAYHPQQQQQQQKADQQFMSGTFQFVTAV